MAMSHCGGPSAESCEGARCAPRASGAAAGYEYIVVGSGAGGGPVAARLARAGKRVLLLEAGDDVGDGNHYRVPAMHGLATEDPAMAWWYFVKHHSDPAVEASNSKVTKDGVLYPRGSALGGSTAVNAMVTVLPSPADWDALAAATLDGSFRASNMLRYEDRVREWLSITVPAPSLALGDSKLTGVLRAAAAAASTTDGLAPVVSSEGAALATLLSHDVNEALRHGEATGLFRLPLATASGTRNGPREHLLRTVAEGFPLTIQTGTFVTRVLWDSKRATPTAIGVEVVRQPHVYGASLAQKAVTAEAEVIRAVDGGEVILAAGTFNTPQLLALSGVGDGARLAKVGVEPVLERPGVGKNLQDRYEAAVVSEFDTPLDVVSPCRLDAVDEDKDPCLASWREGVGVYTTPGFLATVLRRSSGAPLSDLQIFAVPTDARGYYPGYSADAAKARTRFTWLLLKGHTQNRDGVVELVDASPFKRPRIHFHSFDEKKPLADPDLLALVEGVKFARDVAKRARATLAPTSMEEVWPGASVASDEAIARFVRKESWGHHACCTSRMGAVDDGEAVVDSTFRVIGATGLRVVDASVFPTIPGTFIAMPIYMMAEKAADVILEGREARR